MDRTRAAWIDVDLDRLKGNMALIRDLMKEDTGRDIIPMFVIKGQGYGHGIYEVVETMREAGVVWFAAATYSEALIARAAAPDSKVLVLGYIPLDMFDGVVKNEIRSTVWCMEQAKALSDEAVKQGKKAYIHIKIDTGMHRLGFSPDEESRDVIKEISKLPGIVLEGMFTHFATSAMEFGEEKKKFVDVQYARFRHMKKLLAEAGIDIPFKHISNGGIIIDHPQYHEDMARIGSCCYDTFQGDGVRKDRVFPDPAYSLKSEIAQVRDLAPGEGIGYDLTFTTQRQSRIATLALGYADLEIRRLANNGFVLVRGKRAPIVGGICMDQMMIDVTDIEGVRMGDVATLIGKDGDEEITLAEIADWIGIDDYELAISAQVRLPRRYWKNGEILRTVDATYILAESYRQGLVK